MKHLVRYCCLANCSQQQKTTHDKIHFVNDLLAIYALPVCTKQRHSTSLIKEYIKSARESIDLLSNS